MTTQHTPGPWFVCLKSDPLVEDGTIVQSCNDHEVRPAEGVKLGDEAADLRLIAAAPDLLRLLKQALEEKPTGAAYMNWSYEARRITREVEGN